MNADRNAATRRRLLGAGLTLGASTLAGCATPMTGTPSIGRVVIIGGGFAGATAAHYLRKWGGNIEVTLIERNAQFVSCPISNLVVAGYKPIDDITLSYDGLRRMGVRLVRDEVVAIDAAKRTVRLASGDSLAWDRLVVSPGVDFLNVLLERMWRASATMVALGVGGDVAGPS